MTVEEDNLPRTLLPVRCELATPATQWKMSWRLARQTGLSPHLTTFLFKLLHTILPTGERVNRMKPSSSQLCVLCGDGGPQVCESLTHAMVYCVGNKGTFGLLHTVIQSYIPGITAQQILTLDYDLPSSLELPLTWLTAATLSSLWTQRREGMVNLARLKGELEEGCLLFEKGKFLNAFTILKESVNNMMK